LEEDVVALHPARAYDRVRERELQRVPEVQVAGDVRRRVRDREALAGRVGVGVVVAFLLPRPLPVLLDAPGVVPRLHHRRAILLTEHRSASRSILGGGIRSGSDDAWK